VIGPVTLWGDRADRCRTAIKAGPEPDIEPVTSRATHARHLVRNGADRFDLGLMACWNAV
jgi:hypothetical protein